VPGSVLVLGDDTRGFLATVRSLGRRGINVHAAPANFRSPALRSRYITAIHGIPPWMGDGTEWLTAMLRLLRTTHFDLVIPCDETALLPLQRCRAELEGCTRLAIPDDHAIAVLFDKHETRELARRAGVPVAAGRLLQTGDTALSLLAQFGAPVVLKPRRSYSLQTLGARGKVQVVHDAARLQALLNDVDHGETLIEQFFPGQGMGVSLLASQGRILQAFEHHRVREIAGASFYRVSAPLTPELVRACESIVAALLYTGLAMFEFKRSRQGDWILLEINARPWGSMPLPIALGVDFPDRWYRLLTSGEETASVEYRAGVYGRNLLSDMRAWIAEAEARRLNFTAMTGFLMQRTVELFRPLLGREVHDLLVYDDPRPGIAELVGITKAVLQRGRHQLPGTAARRQRHARRQVEQALHSAGGRPHVVFVCLGNICRSPFASALLRARLDGDAIMIGSAGMMPQPGRPTPELGVQAARAHGIDLWAHRSTWLTREAAEGASLLVVFDEISCSALFDRYPGLRTPIINLGQLAAVGNISDPIDGDYAVFQSTYERIAAGTTELASLLRGSSR